MNKQKKNGKKKINNQKEIKLGKEETRETLYKKIKEKLVRKKGKEKQRKIVFPYAPFVSP